jgi:ubiquinone/menaquinone biosynthesis C-methylase UbiE
MKQGREYHAWNEAMVERYDIERYYERSHPLIRWVESRRLDAVVALADARANEQVLEVGVGAGHVLERFASGSRTGVDLSPTMLARTRRRLGSDVRLLQALADALPLRAGSYPVVLCTEVLEHTPDPAAVLRELLRVAGPNGRVVVSIPREENIDRAKAILRRIPLLRRALKNLAKEGNEWHLQQMDLASLRSIASGVGTIERIRSVPFAFMPLRYVALLRQI